MERIKADKLITYSKEDLLGSVFCFPTDTIYGMGAFFTDQEAIKKIYHLKGRDYLKPLANLCSSVEQIKEIGIEITKEIQSLINKYWPGPLTIIFLKDKEKISFRMPNCLPLLKMINRFGLIANTSVNKSNKKELNNYEDINNDFGKSIDYFISDEWVLSYVPSTVIDVSSGNLVIIRRGSIKL